MTLPARRRAELRGVAHHLDPAVHVGQHGVTPALLQALDDALRARELVKVQVSRAAELDVRDCAAQLAHATGAEVVQVIGRTTTLYRKNPELHTDRGGAPTR